MTAGSPGRAGRAVAPLRRLHDRTPLRVRLLAMLLTLVVVALAAVAAVATATLQGYLTDRVDQQLAAAAHGIVQHGPQPFGSPDGDPDRLPSQFVVQIEDRNGRPVTGRVGDLLDAGQPLPDLPRWSPAQAQRRGGHPFTVSASRGDTPWRALAVPFADGSGTLFIAQSLGDVHSTVGRLELVEVLLGLAVVLALAVVGNTVVRASLRPLRDVEHTAAAIAGGDLSRRVPDRDPRTEVGRLGAALNGMLHQIEQAFRARERSEAQARSSEERMRRFVADASHELRTPLTSIRGFAELYRQGAVRDRAHVGQAMRRIEDEATRMGLLVEDLLLLARLDEQRPLERAPVDLLALAGDAVHDTAVVAPERSIRLDATGLGAPPIVLGDESRLRQVLANLLANAVRHTPAGTPVTVRVSTRTDGPGDERAVLEVADEGPGLSPEQASRVFERFYRADPARSRDDGGTGLGLSIVAALVAAHGGSVEVDSQPGAGATFRVLLPLAPQPSL